MSGSYHWDPDRVIGTWGPLPLIGFTAGTFVEFTRDVPALHTPKSGFKRTIYVKRTNTAGAVAATFSPAAEVLDVLAGIYLAMDAGGPTIWQPLTFKDMNTGVVLAACPLATLGEVAMPDGADDGPVDRRWMWVGDPMVITPAGIALAKATATPFP